MLKLSKLESRHKRLLFAAIMSTSGVLLSYFWYISGLEGFIDNNQEPIARLVESLNEVQRKPVTRVIWQAVNKDALLYPGEAIRTSENSGAKIEFIKSGTVVDLEAESLVVLEENQGKLALDFLKGNLMVSNAGEGGGDNSLTLKSGKDKIDVSKADLSLGKSKGGDLNLQVLKGNATLQANGKTIELANGKSGNLGENGLNESKNILQVLSPKQEQNIYIDPTKPEGIAFSWAKIEEGYTVELEAGSQRTKLSRLTSGDGNLGKLNFKPKAGTVFWKLVAKHKDPTKPVLTSQIFKSEVLAKSPVQVLFPVASEPALFSPEKQSLAFKWSNPAQLEKIFIEVAKAANLQNKVFHQKALDLDGIEVPLKDMGTYYYRVTGYLKGTNEYVSTPITKFEYKNRDLIAPQLKTPLANSHLPKTQVDGQGLFLTWDPVPGVEKYKVTVKYPPINKTSDKLARGAASQNEVAKAETKEFETSSNIYRLKEALPGSYTWSVAGINQDGKLSKPSETRQFLVEELPIINWANQDSVYEYVTEKPTLKMGWELGPKDASTYSYRLAKENLNINDVEWTKSQTLKFEKELDQDGSYQVEVQALNSQGTPLAKTNLRTISVLRKPLLPAPNFADNIGPQIEARKNGSADVTWHPVQGAKQYVLQVKNEKGSVVKEEKFDSSSGSLKSLHPGQYKVAVKSIDQFGRVGPAGPEKDLRVPDISDIGVPKVKGFKVK